MYSTKYYEPTTTYDPTYTTGAGFGEGVLIWFIISAILAVIGGILVYFLFVKKKEEPKGKFLKWLKGFLSFKIMWLEPILKVFYYILTIGTVLGSFAFLGLGISGLPIFFICLIGGPIFIRLGYEMTMMFIMIWRNTRDIAENQTKKK